MKRTSGAYEAATFIVRLWREVDDPVDSSTGWRGTAVHVQTGAERGIHDLAALMSFINAWTDDSDADAPEQD